MFWPLVSSRWGETLSLRSLITAAPSAMAAPRLLPEVSRASRLLARSRGAIGLSRVLASRSRLPLRPKPRGVVITTGLVPLRA